MLIQLLNMSQITYNVTALDLHYISLGVEYLAIIVLVILFIRGIIKRTDIIDKRLRSLSWALLALLVIGITGTYVTDLYNYLHTIRPGYIEITKTIKHQTTGL